MPRRLMIGSTPTACVLPNHRSSAHRMRETPGDRTSTQPVAKDPRCGSGRPTTVEPAAVATSALPRGPGCTTPHLRSRSGTERGPVVVHQIDLLWRRLQVTELR